MSSRASSWPAVASFSRVASSVSEKLNFSWICSVVQPRAFSSTVTGWRRLRSMRTPTVSRLSTSNSSHAPRLGMILTLKTSLSVVLSTDRSKYTPGERTSCETTTRSVPLMMNVPLSVITGKSPMKTVWDLISPVVLLVNSAVTKSGAEYVMSLSLHSSTEAFTSSKRGSEKDRDIEPEKSSIGEISARTSSRPPTGASSPASTRRSNHSSLPTSHSKDLVCRSRRSGTSSGWSSLAKETRRGAPGNDAWWFEDLVARVTAKMRPSGTTLSDAVSSFVRSRRSAVPRAAGSRGRP